MQEGGEIKPSRSGNPSMMPVDPGSWVFLNLISRDSLQRQIYETPSREPNAINEEVQAVMCGQVPGTWYPARTSTGHS